MNRVVPLLRTGGVSLERFDHPPGVAHRDAERECAAGHAVNFVETGGFRLRQRKEWARVGPDTIFITGPGLEFSCAHDHDHPDDCCLSISFSEEAIESARSAFAFTPGQAGLRHMTNRRAYLRRALQQTETGDEARLEALAGAVLHSLSIAGAGRPLYRPAQLNWYAARVDAAREAVEQRYAEPLSLSVLAREAGMSLFHFARVFAELEGRTPHRLLLDVRLAQAAARLQDGAGVTETCFAVGFGSLSHFVTTFRQRFGVRPSEVRKGPSSSPAVSVPAQESRRRARTDRTPTPRQPKAAGSSSR